MVFTIAATVKSGRFLQPRPPKPTSRFRTFQSCPKDLAVSSGATSACGKPAQRVPEGEPMVDLRRRQFIRVLGGVAAWPLAARAQQSVVKARRLGLLLPGAPPEPLVEALLERLRELGYREGRDVVFELRWAQGKNERLTELASELVAAKVDVITTISTP